MKGKKLSLEEAIRLATKAKSWILKEKIEDEPIEERMDGPYTVGYKSITKYQGVLNELIFDLTWESHDEYSLTIIIDNVSIAKHEESYACDTQPIPKLKKLFDYVEKKIASKITSDEKNLRLKRLTKTRSYLKKHI